MKYVTREKYRQSAFANKEKVMKRCHMCASVPAVPPKFIDRGQCRRGESATRGWRGTGYASKHILRSCRRYWEIQNVRSVRNAGDLFIESFLKMPDPLWKERHYKNVKRSASKRCFIMCWSVRVTIYKAIGHNVKCYVRFAIAMACDYNRKLNIEIYTRRPISPIVYIWYYIYCLRLVLRASNEIFVLSK